MPGSVGHSSEELVGTPGGCSRGDGTRFGAHCRAAQCQGRDARWRPLREAAPCLSFPICQGRSTAPRVPSLVTVQDSGWHPRVARATRGRPRPWQWGWGQPLGWFARRMEESIPHPLLWEQGEVWGAPGLPPAGLWGEGSQLVCPVCSPWHADAWLLSHQLIKKTSLAGLPHCCQILHRWQNEGTAPAGRDHLCHGLLGLRKEGRRSPAHREFAGAGAAALGKQAEIQLARQRGLDPAAGSSTLHPERV